MRQLAHPQVYWGPHGQRSVILCQQVPQGVVGLIADPNGALDRQVLCRRFDHSAGMPSALQMNVQLHNKCLYILLMSKSTVNRLVLYQFMRIWSRKCQSRASAALLCRCGAAPLSLRASAEPLRTSPMAAEALRQRIHPCRDENGMEAARDLPRGLPRTNGGGCRSCTAAHGAR